MTHNPEQAWQKANLRELVNDLFDEFYSFIDFLFPRTQESFQVFLELLS